VVEDLEGEAFTQREPPIDEPHFTIFLVFADHLMQDDSDITYVFAGGAREGRQGHPGKDSGFRVELEEVYTCLRCPAL
jgi:hypothetical protein